MPVLIAFAPQIHAAADGFQGDQREAHDSGRDVSVDDLSKLGVLYFQFSDVEGVDKLASERNYKNRDEITVSPGKMGDVYEEKVKMFFNEHLHEDEEIRYILDGNGYFDVRSIEDEWVRIHLGAGDLLILPSGIYHRFTTDEKNVGHSIPLRRGNSLTATVYQGYETLQG